MWSYIGAVLAIIAPYLDGFRLAGQRERDEHEQYAAQIPPHGFPLIHHTPVINKLQS